jgi:hypothetical protein
MWTHLTWLLAIPLAGLAAVTFLGGSGTANLGGWIPAVVYIAFQLKFYRLDVNPFMAVLTIVLVPAQIALHVVLFGGGIADFFLEEAFVELASLSLALALVMIAYRPSGVGGAIVGVVIAALAVGGFGWPLVERWRTSGAHPGWFALLGVVMLSAVWTHARFVIPAARDDLAEPTPTAHRGWVTRLVDFFAPANVGTVGVRDPDGLTSVLVIVVILAWFVTPGLIHAVWR